jgi:hypothetical protein
MALAAGVLCYRWLVTGGISHLQYYAVAYLFRLLHWCAVAVSINQGHKRPEKYPICCAGSETRGVVSGRNAYYRPEAKWNCGALSGALASLVILVLLSIQVVSGLLSEDDDLFHEGPLADSVSSAIVVKATGIHNINSSLILIVLGMHVLIMLFYYFWKKENLVGAMISGRKLVVSDEDEADG